MSNALAEYQAGPKEKFFRGDDHDVIRTLRRIPPGQGMLEAWWTVKTDLSPPGDSGAVIQKHITMVDDPASGVIFLDVDAEGKVITLVKFVLVPSETLLFSAGGDYYYDIQGKSTAGHIGTMEAGMLNVVEQVTQVS